MEFSYQSIQSEVRDVIFKEKGSKFITYAFPVSNEKDIEAALTEIRELHPKATHHCYAWRLGITGENYRANDDGEPSGSAGLPIYNQLLAKEITNVLVIVVRYYGGVKLGVGGLVRAYRESAQLALDAAEIVVKELTKQLQISFSYEDQGAVFQILNRHKLSPEDMVSTDHITLTVTVLKKEFEKVVEAFRDLYQVKLKEIL